MDNKKIGEFISTLRKSKNLTQKDLADMLGITDKAVSKWERGAGFPDISMLRPLADALGTTTNELLEGEPLEGIPDTETRNIDNALDYAEKIITIRKNNLGKLTAAILSSLLFIAIFTCVIVNIAVNSCLSWSILVIAGCIMGGCISIPILLWKKRGFYISLFLLTILILPFLGIIESEAAALTGYDGWLWGLGFPVSLTWLIILWFMVLLFRFKLPILFNISISTLLCIPGEIITNQIVNRYTKTNPQDLSNQISNITTIFCLLATTVICFAIGLHRKNKK